MKQKKYNYALAKYNQRPFSTEIWQHCLGTRGGVGVGGGGRILKRGSNESLNPRRAQMCTSIVPTHLQSQAECQGAPH